MHGLIINYDKNKASISVSTLSPFDIVYKNTKPKPPTPAYMIPKTGD